MQFITSKSENSIWPWQVSMPVLYVSTRVSPQLGLTVWNQQDNETSNVKNAMIWYDSRVDVHLVSHIIHVPVKETSLLSKIFYFTPYSWSTRWHSCATRQKVTDSIPDGVNGIFHWHTPSGRTMALGLTQPLIEMSTRNISWGIKVASA